MNGLIDMFKDGWRNEWMGGGMDLWREDGGRDEWMD